MFVIDRFRGISEFAVNRMSGGRDIDEGSLSYWRIQVLFVMVITAVVLFTIAMPAVINLVIARNLWGLALFDAFAFCLALGILTFKRPAYEIRAILFLLEVYAVGWIVTLFVGPLSGGPVWLFTFAVLVAALLGAKSGLAAVGLNGLTLALIGWFISTGRLGYSFPFSDFQEVMISAWANFVLLNAVAVMTVSALLKGLVSSNRKVVSLAASLEDERAQLMCAKKVAETEVEERRRAEAALKKANADLRDLSSRILTAQEEERKGIALDLHDTILQMLAHTQMSLGICLRRMMEGGPPPDAGAIREIMTLVTTSIEDTRSIMEDLRPSLLDHFGIVAALKEHCREFGALYPHIDLQQRMEAREEEIPESLKVPIFRILQEALNNAAKHSEADRIEVVLRKGDEVMELKIADNGVGFCPGKGDRKRRGGGFGLTGMRERTELTGGTFSIDSRKGQGTSLRASWPVPLTSDLD